MNKKAQNFVTSGNAAHIFEIIHIWTRLKHHSLKALSMYKELKVRLCEKRSSSVWFQ